MKTEALYFPRPGAVELRERELPPVGPDEIRVRVRACGVCHGDVALFHSADARAFPTFAGHEAVGEVEEVGAAVTRFAAGDAVALLGQERFARHTVALESQAIALPGERGECARRRAVERDHEIVERRIGFAVRDAPRIVGQVLARVPAPHGQIDAAEVACVPNHLFNAGFIKGGAGPITLSQSDRLITVRAIARSASGVTTFPTSTRNVIEVLNLSCRSAQELDAKSDDGNFASGSTRASVASCVEGITNDPVPSVALAL